MTRRGARRRLAGDGERPGHLGAAQDHQARRRLGDGHPGGPRGRDRRAALPELLPARQHAPGRGRHPHRQGPALAEQGPARAARPGGHRARPLRRPVRPGRDQPALHPVHRPGDRAAQGRPRHPPRHDRGAAAADDATGDQGDAARRPAPGHSEPRPVRRPQAAARARMSDRMTEPAPGATASPASLGGLVPAVLGAVILAAVRRRRLAGRLGVVEAVVAGAAGGRLRGAVVPAPAAGGCGREFAGTGWYVVVALVTGLLLGLVAACCSTATSS